MDKNKVMESAAKLISKGQFEKAVKEFQRVLEVDPDDVRVLQKLAELYQKMNRKAEAADCFEKVAKTYAAQGFYLKAVALYKQVLKVIDRVEVNVRLAELYQQLGLVGDATKEWQTVSAYYDKIGDTKASLDTLKKLVDLDPDNVAARIRLGEQYAREDNLVEAVAELRRAAQYLQRNSRTDDYLRVAERISHLDQSDVTLARELAESYLSRGDSKRALAKLQICFKANPRDLGTLQMLARAFQELGQVSKTVSVLKELARVHLDTGRSPDARKTYQQALDLAPEDQEVKLALKNLQAEQAPRASEPRQPAGKAGPAPAPTRPAPQAAGAPPARPATAPVQAAARPPTSPAAAARPPASAVAAPRPPTSPITSSRPPTAPIPAVSGPPPTAAAVPKLLKETEVYVKYGLHEKALEHLRKIFSADPDNIDAHEKAKVVALATGRRDDAIASLSTLLQLAVKRSDPRAEAARAELRELDPHNAALAVGAAPTVVVEDELVEETIEEEAMEVEPIASSASEYAENEHDEIVEQALEDHQILDESESVEEVEQKKKRAPSAGKKAPAEARGARPEKAAPAPEEEEDEFASDVAEADFYIQAGLPEDARAILEGIAMAAPDHPGVARRLRELGGGQAPRAPAAPVHKELPAGASPGPLPPEHDDLAAELAAELASEAGGGVVDEDRPLDGDALAPFQVPAKEVLGEFRAKVQQAVRPEDVQTHYDLGIAYKEMGLLEEAIAEFDVAVQHGGGTRAADCLTMLGVCELERGRPDAAIERFNAGLQLPDLSPEARYALAFELGAVYESTGQTVEALEQYGSIDREDPNYRDVPARIARLGSVDARPAAAGPQRPGVKPARQASGQAGPQKAAAQGRAALAGSAPSAPVATGARPEPAGDGGPDPTSPEPARKNRKIGFV
jgi:tetratricopeptide (TPR) repeat protein